MNNESSNQGQQIAYPTARRPPAYDAATTAGDSKENVFVYVNRGIQQDGQSTVSGLTMERQQVPQDEDDTRFHMPVTQEEDEDMDHLQELMQRYQQGQGRNSPNDQEAYSNTHRRTTSGMSGGNLPDYDDELIRATANNRGAQQVSSLSRYSLGSNLQEDRPPSRPQASVGSVHDARPPSRQRSPSPAVSRRTPQGSVGSLYDNRPSNSRPQQFSVSGQSQRSYNRLVVAAAGDSAYDSNKQLSQIPEQRPPSVDHVPSVEHVGMGTYQDEPSTTKSAGRVLVGRCMLPALCFMVGAATILALLGVMSMTDVSVFGYELVSSDSLEPVSSKDLLTNETPLDGASPSPDPTTTTAPTTALRGSQPTVTTDPTSSVAQPTVQQPTTTSAPAMTQPTAPAPQPTASTSTPAPAVATTSPPTPSPTPAPVWVSIAGPFEGTSSGLGYGTSVGIAGDLIVSSEPLGASSGQVLVYQDQTELSSVIDSTALDFGSSVDMSVVSGVTSLLVGAKESEAVVPGASTFNFGSASYYEFIAGTWTQIGSILKPTSMLVQTGGEYGAAVAMAGTIRRIAVAAPESSVSSSLVKSGQIFTYQYNTNSADWEAMTSEPLYVAVGETRLGTSLSMSLDGSRLLAGASKSKSGDGSVFYYQWDETTKVWDDIFSFPGGSGDALGTSVAIVSDDGSMIALGAPAYGGGNGVIQVFSQQSGMFMRLPDIVGLDQEKIGTTLCGAKGRVAYGTDTGSFHVYEYSSSNTWLEVATGASTGSPVVSIDMSEDGTTVVVGLLNEQTKVYKLQ